MKKLLRRINRYLRALPEIVRLCSWLLRREEILVPTFGSYGDLLMVNGVLLEYAALKKKRLKVVIKDPILSYNLRFIENLLFSRPVYYLAIRLSRYYSKIRLLNYGAIDEDKENHLMQRIALRLDFQLSSGFSPFYLIDIKRDQIKTIDKDNKKVIAFQSTATKNAYKNWDTGRLQEVVEILNKDYITIQIGTSIDYKLPVQHHFEGDLNIRQSLYLISQVDLFVGTEGALMHGAKSLSIPAVIIFGGFIHPMNSGYEGIYALKSNIHCAPCLRKTGCPYEVACMREITKDQVFLAILDVLNKA